VLVEVPHRISGFFEIVDEINGVEIRDPEKIGSRGAGFCLSAIGKTEIITEDCEKEGENKIEIFINGENFNQKAETTHYVLDYIKKIYKKTLKIRVNHSFELPVGCGYGASGSGALGTIFGLNHLFNLNLNYHERGRIAHIAEVENRTGLGTVCGQLGRGLCMLKEPGYPCNIERINVPMGIKIICGSFGMIHTKSILTDPILSKKIKEAGKKALKRLIQEPNMKTFINASIEFVNATDMLDILQLEKTKELMDNLNKLTILGASMNQLGRSVYAIGYENEVKDMLEVFDTFKPDIKVFNLEINNNYPRIIKS
jgi:pantoate kinase